MAFPVDVLPAAVKVLIDGEWVTVTDNALGGKQKISITRGRQDESARIAPSSCTLGLRNASGEPGTPNFVPGVYSPRNPLSPYFGRLGRNTPIRVEIDGIGDPYIALPGSITTPDHSSLDITGDLDVRVEVAYDDWSQGGPLAAKYLTSGDQRSWHFFFLAGGVLDFRWSTAGTFATIEDVFSAALTLSPGQRLAVRATIDVDDGFGGHAVRFYTAPELAGPWTQHGGTVTVPGTTSIFSGTADVSVGDPAGVTLPRPAGRLYGCEVRNGIGGTVVANPTADLAEPGTGGFTDTAGRPWTLAGGAWTSDPRIRFSGEVPSWPPRWDPTGTDLWMPITAAGIMRRLEKSAGKLRSALYREATAAANSAFMVGYWPCEDQAGSTQVASGIAGGSAMTSTIAQPNFAASSDVFTGSEPLLTMVGNALIGNVPHRASTGVLSFRGLFFIPAAGLADGAMVAQIHQTGGGNVDSWRLIYGTGGTLRIRALNGDGTTAADGGVIGFDCRGKRLMIGFSVEQDGSSVDWHIFTRQVDDQGNVLELGFDNTFASLTVGSARRLIVAASGQMSDTVVGHLMVGNSASLAALMNTALVGHAGETAVDRVRRVCDEEDIPLAIVGDDGNSTRVGPQRPDTLLAIVRDACDTDGGIGPYEPRDFFGLAYRTRASLQDRATKATFNYLAQELSPPLEPVDDDQHIQNDVTVSRIGGSSFRAVKTSGTLNVNDPRDDPDGVGTYAADINTNAADDGQLPHIAGWARHMGTWDESRYPVISIDHGSLGAAGKTGLSTRAAEVDLGDLIAIDDPPESLPPDQIVALVQGGTETIDGVEWKQSYHCAPGNPWDVGVWGEDLDATPDRYDTAGSELSTSIVAGTSTSALVLTTSGPLWTTDDAKVSASRPMDVRCSGARLRVTDIAHGFEDLFSGSHSGGFGPDWTVSDAANSTVSGGRARISQSSVAVMRYGFYSLGAPDQRVRMTATLDAGAFTGAQAELWLFARVADIDNNYSASLAVETDDEVQLTIARRTTAGGFATIAGPVRISTAFGAGQLYTVDFSAVGSTLLAKAWAPATMTDPGWILSVTDSTITAGNLAGIGARLAGGNTNALPVVAQYDDFTILNPQRMTTSTTVVNGVAKTISAGEPLRLWKPAIYART